MEHVEEKVVHLKEVFRLYQLGTLNKKHSACLSNLYSRGPEQNFEESIVFWKKHFFIPIWHLDWKTTGRLVKLASYATTRRNLSNMLKSNKFLKKPPSHVLSTLSEWLQTELRTAIYLSKRKFWGLSNWQKIFLSSFSEFEQKNMSEIWWNLFSMALRAEFKVSGRTFWCTTLFWKVRLLLSIWDFDR